MVTIGDLNDLKKLGCVDPWIYAGLDREQQSLSIDKIELIVCSCVKIPPERLKKKSRIHELVLTRQLVYYFCKQYIINSFDTTLSTVASRYGQDHATVCHGHKTISNVLDIHVDTVLCNKVMEIDEKIKAYIITSKVKIKTRKNGK